jgi:hypothetical protein
MSIYPQARCPSSFDSYRRASRHPNEVELVDGEFWFITAYLADAAVGNE